MREEALSKAIDSLYEAAARPELWRPALHELALATDAQGAQMLHHRPEGAAPHTTSEGLDEVSAAFFREGWNVDNPREVRARKRGFSLQEVVTDATLFTREELDAEPWQRDFLDRFGLRWFSCFNAITFDIDSPVVLTIERPAARDPFDASEVEALSAIVPHFQRACRLSVAIASASERGMMDALDHVEQPAFLLNDAGAVIQYNATAERYIGQTLSISDRRLRATDRDNDSLLQGFIANLTHGAVLHGFAAPDAIALRRPNQRPLIAQGSPLVRSARELFRYARAIILLRDLDRRAVPDDFVLKQLFGLTPAETRLAHGLAAQLRLSQVAQAQGISPETARVQLKAIFAKTATHSQSELAVLLDRIAGPFVLPL